MEQRLDNRGRKRNQNVTVRLSPEENAQLIREAKLAGMTRQEYIIQRVMRKEVTVMGNPRVYKALREEFVAVLDELRRVEAGTGADPDLLDTIRMMTAIMGGMKEDTHGT